MDEGSELEESIGLGEGRGLGIDVLEEGEGEDVITCILLYFYCCINDFRNI